MFPTLHRILNVYTHTHIYDTIVNESCLVLTTREKAPIGSRIQV